MCVILLRVVASRDLTHHQATRASRKVDLILIRCAVSRVIGSTVHLKALSQHSDAVLSVHLLASPMAFLTLTTDFLSFLGDLKLSGCPGSR
jgi:hypothetical protein